MKRIIKILVAIFGVGFLLAQLIPYGRSQTNPPILQEPDWDSTETRALAQAACFDCHSNETTWPWYGRVAPGSWLMQRDVDHGRDHLNFSEWGIADKHEDDDDDLADVLLEGEMPLQVYLLAHPEARLTPAQREQLAAGLVRTAAQSPTGAEHQEEDEHDDDH